MKRYLLFFFLMLAGCRMLPTEVSERVGDLLFSLSLEDRAVAFGDTVRVKFSVTNLNSEPVTFIFPNLQQFGIRISLRGNLVYYSPIFSQPAFSGLTLEPGASHIYQHDWDQESLLGVIPCVYEVVAYLLNDNSPELVTRLLIEKLL